MLRVPIKIPAELFAQAESSSFEGEFEPKTLAVGPDDYSFSAPLPWQVEVTNTGAALLVSGSVRGQGVCACSRCLEDVTHSFEGTVEGYFLIASAQGDVQSESEDFDDYDEDDFEVLPEDHILDLAPLLEAALIVDAPAMPLCREDCAGLCPQCGANLNEGPCSCGPDPALADFERESNPFSALADFEF